MSDQDPYAPLKDKLEFLDQCIKEVEAEIRIRQKQAEDFLDELDKKAMAVQNTLFKLESLPAERERQTALEKEIKILEQEKRQQRLDCWKDVSHLQKEIRQLKREHRAVAGVLCFPPKN
jgi:chromosome segregation protein